MGFSHTMTGHHFHLFPDGGSIEVESDRPDDNASKEAIRRHMLKIAGMFEFPTGMPAVVLTASPFASVTAASAASVACDPSGL